MAESVVGVCVYTRVHTPPLRRSPCMPDFGLYRRACDLHALS